MAEFEVTERKAWQLVAGMISGFFAWWLNHDASKIKAMDSAGNIISGEPTSMSVITTVFFITALFCLVAYYAGDKYKYVGRKFKKKTKIIPEKQEVEWKEEN